MNYLNRPKVRMCSIELQVQRALLTQPPKLRALDLMSDAYAALSSESQEVVYRASSRCRHLRSPLPAAHAARVKSSASHASVMDNRHSLNV